MDARTVARVIQEKVQRAAQDTRAFDTAKITAVSAGGSMSARVPGKTTDIQRLGQGNVVRGNQQVGDDVLIIKMSGGYSSAASIGVAPYMDGDTTEIVLP